MKTLQTNKILVVALIVISTVTLFLFLFPSKNSSSWKKLDLEKFTLVVPRGWRYVPAQGIDSFIGTIEGDGIKLSFEHGWYGSASVNQNDKNYVMLNEKIDNKDARIYYPKNSKPGKIGLFIGNMYGDSFQPTILNIEGTVETEEQKQVVLKIIRSVDL